MGYRISKEGDYFIFRDKATNKLLGKDTDVNVAQKQAMANVEIKEEVITPKPTKKKKGKK